MKYFSSFIFLVMSCGSQYVVNPNTQILVTSQYENEPERIISSTSCNSTASQRKMSEAECAVSLYHESEKFLNVGKKLMKKNLYVSAQTEFMKAISKLKEAKIRLNVAKTSNFDDYVIVMHFGLEKKVNERINLCERLLRSIKWQR